MSDKIKGTENEKKGIKDKAINIKQNQSDGREISQQENAKQEKHQPRDTA